MRLAFIILAHEDVANLQRLLSRLIVINGAVDGDISVVIHWDKKNPIDLAHVLAQQLSPELLARIRYAPRFAVQWGGWSMVAATLASLVVLEHDTFDYVILLSGADYALKPITLLKHFLAAHQGQEYIESVAAAQADWIVHGIKHERYRYFHNFNWRTQPRLFTASLYLQKKLGINRRLPEKLSPHFGSQWWALTQQTALAVLSASRRPALRRFFQRTWIPDELFFATLVAAQVPRERIVGQSLTFYHFSQQGRPLVFYDDHSDFLRQQDYFFARKLSPDAHVLRDNLDAFIAGSTRFTTHLPTLAKHLVGYEQFRAVQWRGLPNRRILGRQQDAWYGDLEWNKTPYFVLLCDHNLDIEPLRKALNALTKVRCYGELFRRNSIDYAIVGAEHPLYPCHKVALRDMKQPNFLVDLIHAAHNTAYYVGFVLRVPCQHDIDKIVSFDAQAALIVIASDAPYLSANDTLHGSTMFNAMIMSDNMHILHQARKPFLRITAQQHSLSSSAIQQVCHYVQSSSTGSAC